MYFTSLQRQTQYNGSWYGWGHLGCDNSQRSILDYSAVKVSDTEWHTTVGAPGSGQC